MQYGVGVSFCPARISSSNHLTAFQLAGRQGVFKEARRQGGKEASSNGGRRRIMPLPAMMIIIIIIAITGRQLSSKLMLSTHGRATATADRDLARPHALLL